MNSDDDWTGGRSTVPRRGLLQTAGVAGLGSVMGFGGVAVTRAGQRDGTDDESVLPEQTDTYRTATTDFRPSV
jgi:hypothetical protein